MGDRVNHRQPKGAARSRRDRWCALLAVSALLLTCACSASPARHTAQLGADRLLERLEERNQEEGVTTGLVVVGGFHRLGEQQRAVTGEHDDALARTIEHELVFALHERLRIVDQSAMEVALDVLRMQQSDLYQDDEESVEALRHLGRFLKAELFVTGDYLLDKSGELEVDYRVLDIGTLEVLATARASSRTSTERIADGTVYAGAIATTPFVVLWDIFGDVAETCFTEDEPGLGNLLVDWLKVPFYLPISPFLTEYDTTRWWLRIDGEANGGHPTGPAGASDGALATSRDAAR